MRNGGGAVLISKGVDRARMAGRADSWPGFRSAFDPESAAAVAPKRAKPGVGVVCCSDRIRETERRTYLCGS